MEYLLTFMLMWNSLHSVSYYGDDFHGKIMANGKSFNKNAFTCAANKFYPLGSKLLVTNPENNNSVIVTVTDRGKFDKYNRTLDLSEKAFKKLGNLKKGTLKCKIEIL